MYFRTVRDVTVILYLCNKSEETLLEEIIPFDSLTIVYLEIN